MATATLGFPIGSGTLADGSASNAAPQITRRKGSETAPAKHALTADFDQSTDEHMWWTFTMPQNYASGGTVRLQWTTSVTANSVVWGARLGAVTPADADTPLEHAQAAATTATTAANTTEARRLVETTITLGNLDSVAAGDLVFLLVYRDADNGSDGVLADAELWFVSLDYTTT